MRAEFARAALEAALLAFRTHVMGIDLFSGWKIDYPNRLRSAYLRTLNLIETLGDILEVEGLPEQSLVCVNRLLEKRQFNTDCSLYELVRYILEVQDSGRSAEYLSAFILAERVANQVWSLIIVLEEMAAETDSTTEPTVE